MNEELSKDARQELVVRVLADLLEAPDLDREDDFFEQGGHSLLVIRAVATLKDKHSVSLPARAFIEDSRIGAIAASSTSL